VEGESVGNDFRGAFATKYQNFRRQGTSQRSWISREKEESVNPILLANRPMHDKTAVTVDVTSPLPVDSKPVETFDFRPLAAGDLELLYRWLNAPHAKHWFGGGRTIASVHEEYSEYIHPDQPIRAYIIEHAGRAIGLLNWERMGDSPDFQRVYEVEDPNSVNCDMLIGEIEALHRGQGATILRQFLQRIVFVDPRLTSCVIDPVPDNAIAIRMYEKAGFRFVRALPEDGEGNAVYLLELSRAELFSPVQPRGDFYVRPAREAEIPTAIEIDDDACTLYYSARVHPDFERTSQMARAPNEIERWTEAVRLQRLLFACTPEGQPVGFAVLDFVDGKPHLDQLSVRRAFMKRGIGKTLVDRAKAWSVRAGQLWITTYSDIVPWNAPWYRRLGFVSIEDQHLEPELARRIAEERQFLPAGHERVAMVFRHCHEKVKPAS